MATSFSKKMKELRRVVKLHTSWLIYATLGESAISKDELEELTKYKKLPMGSSLELVDKSYLLGRLKAILKKSEYKKVSYEEAVEAAEGMKLSSLEDLVLEQARLKAGSYIKSIAGDITNGVFDSLSTSLGQTISEATVREAVADETALAIIYKKTSQQLASDLAARLQTGHKKDWTKVARTELHRAKVAGHAQAIVNKVDIYANGDGPNSKVSIIPGAGCCEDCTVQYTDGKGTPLVFSLSKLIAAGSNADAGVSHSKRNGKHIHWKTTLPPLHPSCFCQLVYIPAGYGWEAGKLVLKDKEVFEKSLRKAVDAPGKSTGGVTKVDAVGPPKTAEPPKPASVPGSAGAGGGGANLKAGSGLPKPPSAPKAGAPTTPKSISPFAKQSTDSGPSDKYVSCPFGGGVECAANGGPSGGALQHKQGGSVMRKHNEARAKGVGPALPPEEEHAHLEAASKFFGKQEHPDDILRAHLSYGHIAAAKKLGAADGAGVTAAYKAEIEGNGSACVKSVITYNDNVYDGTRGYPCDGGPNMPPKSSHVSATAAHALVSSLGFKDHVPMCVSREHDGSSGVPFVGSTSMSSWQDDYTEKERHKQAAQCTDLNNLCSMSPNPESFKEKMLELASLDIVMNNNDRHMNNFLFKKDMTDVKGMDHDLCFGSGMAGHKNTVAMQLHRQGEKFVVPEKLITKYKNQSLAQTRRALEKTGLKDHQIVQAHLRMKYQVHLQEQHGHIPIEATRLVQGSGLAAHETGDPPAQVARLYGWKPGEEQEELSRSQGKWETPDLLFARFAKSFISGGLNSDLTEEERSELIEARPVFAPGKGHSEGLNPAADDPTADHKQFWDSIPEFKPMKSWPANDSISEPIRTPPEAPASQEPRTATSERLPDLNYAAGAAVADANVDAMKAAAERIKARKAAKAAKEAEGTLKSLFILDLHKSFPLDTTR